MSDLFFRADNFKDEPWYEEFQIFMRIGVCKPQPEHLEAVKAALLQIGYETVSELPYDGEIREIMQPPRPVQTCEGIRCQSPYHIPEEELLIWVHVSPNSNLIQSARERYMELFKQVFVYSAEEYLRRNKN